MLQQATSKHLHRKDDRIIIHFDYDCFYASVVEAERPELKSLPLAIQQKQIIVTCNYEARRRGLFKLQLITEARKVCPDVIIVLGEDLTRFRDASKDLYHLIRTFSWNDRVERLGFDEVWMDVTDIVSYNQDLLNPHGLSNSFYQLSKADPTAGFAFDATRYAGHVHPQARGGAVSAPQTPLEVQLMLGSHLAMHIRHALEERKGYTSTVGISTTKLISKLCGNMNKPKGQTTLLPPYDADQHEQSNILAFLDGHDIGAIPWVGFKLAQKLREHYLGRAAEYDFGLVVGGTREKVTVGHIRNLPDLSPGMLEKLLAGPGAPHGIGGKIFGLVHGIDESEVIEARNVPRQISIEDSYIRLDTMHEVLRELTSASSRLIQRMRVDLTELDSDDGPGEQSEDRKRRRWIGRPETLRLSTRPRQPVGPDGQRPRSFARISRSAGLPRFVFHLDEHVDSIAERLVKESLVPLFKRLHPEKSGWNLSLMNVAVTNMVDVGASSKASVGRDIHSMFARQDDVLKDFRVRPSSPALRNASDEEDEWDDGEDEAVSSDVYQCPRCASSMPGFARAAHERFHDG